MWVIRNFSKWGLRPSSLPVGTCFLSGAATLGVLDQFVAPSRGQLFCGFGKCNDLWSKGYRARRRMGAVHAWIRFCVHEMLGALPGPALVSPFFVFNVTAVAICGSFHLLGVVVNIFATSSAVALAAKLDLSCWTGCSWSPWQRATKSTTADQGAEQEARFSLFPTAQRAASIFTSVHLSSAGHLGSSTCASATLPWAPRLNF